MFQNFHAQALMLPISPSISKAIRKGVFKEAHCCWILATFLVMEILRYQLVDSFINKNNLFRS